MEQRHYTKHCAKRLMSTRSFNLHNKLKVGSILPFCRMEKAGEERWTCLAECAAGSTKWVEEQQAFPVSWMLMVCGSDSLPCPPRHSPHPEPPREKSPGSSGRE